MIISLKNYIVGNGAYVVVENEEEVGAMILLVNFRPRAWSVFCFMYYSWPYFVCRRNDVVHIPDDMDFWV